MTSLEEELIRIQVRIAKKLKQATVKVAGPSLQNGVDVPTAISALGGVVHTGLDFEFLNNIGTG